MQGTARGPRSVHRVTQNLDGFDLRWVNLQRAVTTHFLASSSARYPRTCVPCCENLPKFAQGKIRTGVEIQSIVIFYLQYALIDDS